MLVLVVFGGFGGVSADHAAPPERLRLIIETDAGGDPDDEQSLVRFLLYTSEWDVEGVIANRPRARDGENQNPVRTGLGIVQAQLVAHGTCWNHVILDLEDDGRPHLFAYRRAVIAIRP